MSASQEDIIKELKELMHPEINNSLLELGMIGRVDEKGMTVELKLPVPDVPIKDMLIDMIRERLQKRGFDVSVETTVMTYDERERFMALANKNWAL